MASSTATLQGLSLLPPSNLKHAAARRLAGPSGASRASAYTKHGSVRLSNKPCATASGTSSGEQTKNRDNNAAGRVQLVADLKAMTNKLAAAAGILAASALPAVADELAELPEELKAAFSSGENVYLQRAKLNAQQAAPQGEPLSFDLPALDIPAVDLPSIDIDIDPSTALAVGGSVAFAGLLGFAVSLLFRKSYAGNLTPEAALEALTEEGSTAVFVDIRSKEERGEEGSPVVKGATKRLFAIAFEVEVDGELVADEEFAERVGGKNGVEEDTQIIIIDKDGKLAVAAAKQLFAAGFKNSFAVTGGTDAWREAELPWREPRSLPSLDFTSFESLSESAKAALPAAAGVAAAAGLAAFVAVEGEVLVQIVGSAALLQLAASKLLFAEDRKKTISQLQALFGPPAGAEGGKEVDAAAVTVEVTAAEAAEAAPEAAVAEVVPTEAAPAAVVAEEAVAKPEAAVAAEAVATKAASSTDFPPAPRPLSPYALYPDLKPPTSPTPLPPTAADTATSPAPVAEPVAEPPVVAAAKTSSTDFPPSPTPLSPFATYPDLKPPTSPTPSPPTTAAPVAVAAEPAAEPVVEAVAEPPQAPKPTSSTDFPPSPTPLSPYALYPDLKPPTSPTPSPPVVSKEVVGEAAVAEAAPAAAEVAEPAAAPQAPALTEEQLATMWEIGEPAAEAKETNGASVAAADKAENGSAAGEGNGSAAAAPFVRSSSTDFPPPPRPLSPYALYPDLKPPSSPSPSRPT